MSTPALEILAAEAFDALAPEVPWDFTGFSRLLEAVEAKCALQEKELAGQIACRAGCHHCCRRIPSILPLERAWIREMAKGTRESKESARPEEDSTGVRLEGRGGSDLRSDLHPDELLCGHLDVEGLCRIYAARPLICRTHGMLILSEEGLDHCPWNFRDLEEVDENLVFRLENLHETLLKLNLAFLRRSYPSDFARLAAVRIEFQAVAESP